MTYGIRWRRAVVVSVIFHGFFLTGAGYVADWLFTVPAGKERYLELDVVHQPPAETVAVMNPTDSASQAVLSAVVLPPPSLAPRAAASIADISKTAAVAWQSAVVNGTEPAISSSQPGIAKAAAPSTAGPPRSGNLDSLMEAFIRRLEESKEYPYMARKRGQTGTVMVRVCLTPEGNLGEAVIVSSSGVSRLDEAALKLVCAACPFSHGLGRPLVMTVPITYDLKEQ